MNRPSMAEGPSADVSREAEASPEQREPEGGAQAPPPEPAPDTGSPDPQVAELQTQLESAQAQAQALREQLLRAGAELENLRKRSARELENAHKYALERFVAALLPVKDSLELGLAASQDEEVDVAKLREGSDLTLRMLTGAVEKFGVAEVNPEGEAFNPELHQAMSTQEVAGSAPGTVITVVQKGYLLNDRLVRPALVIVAR